MTIKERMNELEKILNAVCSTDNTSCCETCTRKQECEEYERLYMEVSEND